MDIDGPLPPASPGGADGGLVAHDNSLGPPDTVQGALIRCVRRAFDNFLVGSSTSIGAESPDDADTTRRHVPHGPYLPREFIKIVYHENSGRGPEIISLDPEMPQADRPSLASTLAAEPSISHPWAPFACQADFEFAEAMLKIQASRNDVDTLLQRIHGSWSRNGSYVTFRNYGDMEKALNAAREFVTDFKTGRVSVEYNGQMIEHTFLYRDPWEWITKMCADPTLAKTHIWHSARKYYCTRDSADDERLLDEPNTASRWWSIETDLGKGHFFLPLHLWLDKGKVSNKVRMHPILLRPLFQPGEIRNASGNGGGLLLAFMPAVTDPLNPELETPKNDSDDFALYKRRVYNAIFEFIFESCRLPSHVGRTVPCGDGVDRIVHPDVMIAALDGEEASFFCGCYAATANHPSIKCEAHKDDLSNLVCSAPKRTVTSMRSVYEEAKSIPTKTHRQALLGDHGLHLIPHFLWRFRHSDPYAAFGFDTLHKLDAGVFGHHLWPLVREELKKSHLTRQVNQNMSLFPPWPGIERFSTATNMLCNIDFSDGETFFSISKTLIPCIVQVMPQNSSIVQALSWYIGIRMLVGLLCSSRTILHVHLPHMLEKYQYWCSRVTKDYGKNFNFFKQHNLAHVVESIEEMATTQHQSTRPGEGFIQEVKQQYRRSNGRNVEQQMTTQDARAEAIAQIRTSVDAAIEDAERRRAAADLPRPSGTDDEVGEDEPEDDSSNSLGAPISRRWEDLDDVEQTLSTQNVVYRDFDARLRAFIATDFPRLATELRGNIKIMTHRCAYIHYASVEDFRGARDILRCTSSWYGKPRYDCVLLESDTARPRPARLQGLYKCRLMTSADVIDVALVRRFVPSTWKPKTKFRGCRVYEESAEHSFVRLSQIIRGAVMCPAFGAPKDTTHYLMDTTGGGDLFLRLNDMTVS
ncbi:hypothetical protein EXIGLDRAFT_634169 [Exidia glandulosa HHB12029]|uniref:Uncharacterized protein n=1 Tax=Exidia glandulosa HHB12029 TaxID=1314781 RepID=A0A166MRY3_EXIGL|nr:hypothetical protein EXIGLDRAFT_634169 [Exidia glandulosa HHB12029]